MKGLEIFIFLDFSCSAYMLPYMNLDSLDSGSLSVLGFFHLSAFQQALVIFIFTKPQRLDKQIKSQTSSS